MHTYITRCTRDVREECDPITVLGRCVNPTLLQRKWCSEHMTVFEIVVHPLDTIIGMMYLGADNSSIDYRGTFTIHSYSQLHDLLRCNVKKCCVVNIL